MLVTNNVFHMQLFMRKLQFYFLFCFFLNDFLYKKIFKILSKIKISPPPFFKSIKLIN